MSCAIINPHPIGCTVHDGNTFGVVTAKSQESYLVSYGARSAILHSDEFIEVDPSAVTNPATRALLRDVIAMALAVHVKRQDCEQVEFWNNILRAHKGG